MRIQEKDRYILKVPRRRGCKIRCVSLLSFRPPHHARSLASILDRPIDGRLQCQLKREIVWLHLL